MSDNLSALVSSNSILISNVTGHYRPPGHRAEEPEGWDGPAPERVPGPAQCQDGPGHRDSSLQVLTGQAKQNNLFTSRLIEGLCEVQSLCAQFDMCFLWLCKETAGGGRDALQLRDVVWCSQLQLPPFASSLGRLVQEQPEGERRGHQGELQGEQRG